MWIINFFHIINSRPLRALKRQMVNCLEGGGCPRSYDLDPPIWQVLHPSVELEAVGATDDKPPAPHALHAPRDDPAEGRQSLASPLMDLRCRTTYTVTMVTRMGARISSAIVEYW